MTENELKHYYLVTAKCGHVGKRKYYEVNYPIIAESAHIAAQRILKRPKVKKQLKDAISYVIEIDFEEYIYQRKLFSENEYISAHTKKELVDYFDIARTLEKKKREYKKSFVDRIERINYIRKRNRIIEEEFVC